MKIPNAKFVEESMILEKIGNETVTQLNDLKFITLTYFNPISHMVLEHLSKF